MVACLLTLGAWSCAGGDGGSDSEPDPPAIQASIALFEGAGTLGRVVPNGSPAANGRDFGAIELGTGPSLVLTITVFNAGIDDLTLGTPTTGNAAFNIVLGGFQTTVRPQQTTSFELTFEPSAAGDSVATVSITHNAGSTPFTFGARGVGTSGGLPLVAPDVSIAPALGVSENAGVLRFPVTLSAPTGHTVTVAFDTADVTALAGVDYVAQSGVLTFNPGQTSLTADVVILDDTDYEPGEQIQVLLSSPSNAVIATASATGTITNDDAPSYAQHVQPLFDTYCTGCHPSSGGLNLTNYAQVMSGTVVVPGNASVSLLMRRIDGSVPPTMPAGFPPLSASEQQTIRDWINAGALNN